MVRNVLAIAGSDPSGGAGIQADLKTFGALGCYGMAVPTALTVQNTVGVRDILPLTPAFVVAQVEALFADIRIDAIKIGMIGSPDVATALGVLLRARPNMQVVLDPVLAATSGDALGDVGVAAAILRELVPLATLVTPNLAEAATLTGTAVATLTAEMEAAGRALLTQGARAVLVKGGHLIDSEATDVLATRDGCEHFTGRRIATRNTHGTGCTLSSAIAVGLARELPLSEAIRVAKTYLEAALAGADRLTVGTGHGPVDHFHGLHRV